MDRAARLVGHVRRDPWWFAGGLASVVVALALFSRYPLDSLLSRDEAIYVYGGQRLADGVAPYAGIFDPKPPLAIMLSGAAVQLARVVGRGDLSAVRAVFGLCAVLAVLATYLLGVRLFRSVAAGLTAAVVLASFSCFAADALGGPNAKTPGVLLLVLSMLLTVRRSWFWAGVAGGLAFLVWQPLIGYPFVTVVVAAFLEEGPRRLRSAARALGGAALPVLALLVYLASAGALGAFLDASLVFPLTGVHRGTPADPAIVRMVEVAHASMGWSGVVLLVGGLVLLVGAAVLQVLRRRSEPRRGLDVPVVAVVLTTFVLQFGYANTDFQGYPDLYPLLPYAGLGFGALVAHALARARRSWGARGLRAATGLVLGGLVVLATAGVVDATGSPLDNHDLVSQRAAACAIERTLTPGSRLWSLGNPVPLVLTHRRNPDRFIFLNSGVGQWKIDHHGGLGGWEAQIRDVDPSVILLNSWNGLAAPKLVAGLLDQGYVQRFLGNWRVFVTPEVIQNAPDRGVQLSTGPGDIVLGPATSADRHTADCEGT